MTDYDIIQRIRALMQEKNLSINMLAQLSDVSQSTLSSLMNRENSPTLPTLTKICNGLNITITQFFLSDVDYQVTLNKDQRLLLQTFNSLNPGNQALFLKILEDIKNSQDDKLTVKD